MLLIEYDNKWKCISQICFFYQVLNEFENLLKYNQYNQRLVLTDGFLPHPKTLNTAVTRIKAIKKET